MHGLARRGARSTRDSNPAAGTCGIRAAAQTSLGTTTTTESADEGVTVTVTAQPIVTAERESALLASVPTGLLIDGEWRAASGRTFDVHDPATGKVLLPSPTPGPRTARRRWTRRRRPGVLGAGPAAGTRRDPAPRLRPGHRAGRGLRAADDPGDGQAAGRGPRRGHLRRRVPALVLRGDRPRLRPLPHHPRGQEQDPGPAASRWARAC